jgi:hypothetical protein
MVYTPFQGVVQNQRLAGAGIGNPSVLISVWDYHDCKVPEFQEGSAEALPARTLCLTVYPCSLPSGEFLLSTHFNNHSA